jgi:hypothetical protein
MYKWSAATALTILLSTFPSLCYLLSSNPANYDTYSIPITLGQSHLSTTEMHVRPLSAGLLSLASLLAAAPTGSTTTGIYDSEDAAFDHITHLNSLSNTAMLNKISNGACTSGQPYRRRIEW